MSDILMRPVVWLQVTVAELREREDGQTTTEYAILLGFLAIAIIIALFFLRNVLRGLFSDAASSVSNARRLISTGQRGRAEPARPRPAPHRRSSGPPRSGPFRAQAAPRSGFEADCPVGERDSKGDLPWQLPG